MKLKNKSPFNALPKRTSVPLDKPLHWMGFFNFKDMENWKDIPGFEGSYQVSDLGRVRSLDRYVNGRSNLIYLRKGKILSPAKHNDGYYQLKLSKGKSCMKTYKIHRLVMLAFVGESELTVNHKNENKRDNSLLNLEYMTHAENVTYSRGVKILDVYTGKTYLSQSDAARDLYAKLGYKHWNGLYVAISKSVVKRLQGRFEIINS